MNKFASLFLLVALVLFTPSFAEERITVEIPAFRTELNGREINNLKAQYPLIIYKDITYFPMTYDLSRELGLITGWDSEQGLFIASCANDYYSEYMDTNGNNMLHTKYDVILPSYSITLNGLKIDNSKEEYPILNFRNITYFPMTWRFVHDELGWTLIWDNYGLKVLAGSTEILPLSVKEVNNKYAVLQSCETIYKVSKNDDNDEVYENTGIEYYYNYKLDYATDEVEKLPNAEKIVCYETNTLAKDVSSKFTLSSEKLFYNSKELFDLKEINFENGNYVIANSWDFKDISFIGVTIMDTSVPAPYTPRAYYAFRSINGELDWINSWDTMAELNEVYNLDNGYYLCSNHMYLGGRGNNICGTIFFDDANGNIKNINEEYQNYNSLRALGVCNGKLAILATWFPNCKTVGYGEVSLMNDGFFYLADNRELIKIHDFIDGDTFITPNGGLYCISRYKSEIVNLITGRRINVE